jgi:hypothetical protein
MFSYEKSGEACINDADQQSSKTLNAASPMIAILFPLVLAILFSLVWRDPPVKGIQQPSPIPNNPPES